MNNIEKMFGESKNVEQYAGKYFSYLSELLDRIDKKAIAAFICELEDAYKNDNTIFVAGNGGSAATASHMANDLGMDVLKKSNGVKAFRVMSITDNNSLMTAIANDEGYENLFVNQLRIYYRKGDKLISISASGNSPNVVKAAEWVKGKGGKALGLLGFDGGRLAELCDPAILVKTPGGEYGPVEDIHMVIDHLLATWLQYRMFSKKGDLAVNG